MQVEPLDIAGAFLITPMRHGDHRGYFSEVYRADKLLAAGIEIAFVQDNIALSAEKGVVRGLHWQEPPHAQDKLIQVLDGAIQDVIVDIRRGSPTFGRHLTVMLDAASGAQLLAPKGVAHGYCTLKPDTRVLYKTSHVYAPEAERGLLWNDPALGIDWRVSQDDAILSAKDKAAPRLSQLTTAFT